MNCDGWEKSLKAENTWEAIVIVQTGGYELVCMDML